MEGNGWRVSWCFGHLAEPAKPEEYNQAYKKWRLGDLPIIPSPFVFHVQEKTADQFELLKKLLHDVNTSEVVNACDAGREGELIFRNVYTLAGCTKPMKRLWISSMEDSAIREGFQQLHAGSDYNGLYRSAYCRAEADWLIGINASRFFSLTHDAKLNVGRVMSPTLALLVQREADIDAFTPTPFWTVRLDLGGFTAFTERMNDRVAALKLASACTGVAKVVSLEKKKKSEKAPALYDLTTLQRDANRLLGYSAQQTLDYLQTLYEKKLCSYPRTDSRFLTDDMEPSVGNYVAIAGSVCGEWPPARFNAKQICNSKKVSDHHALIPTLSATSTATNALPLGEREILRLVSLGLLRAVSDPYKNSETVAVFECAGARFTAKGKTVLDPGWRIFDRKPEAEEASGEKDQPAVLPALAEGQELPVSASSVKSGQTTPPKHFTEDTLLSAMETAGAKDMPEDAERKGLGTPATRAAILEKLISAGYMERQKAKKVSSLLPTDAGKALITVLPEALQSPQLTAEWEYRLKQIERSELEPKVFLDGIAAMLRELFQAYKAAPGTELLFPNPQREKHPRIGPCPRCGGDVIELEKGFVCADRSCGFAIWKASHFFTNKRIVLTPDMVMVLLLRGRVGLKGCYSEKTGNTYDAIAVMEDDGQKTDFRLEFPKRNSRRQKNGR